MTTVETPENASAVIGTTPSTRRTWRDALTSTEVAALRRAAGL